MSIIPKLATSLNRRDEVPNQELAAEIVESNDNRAIAELVENLANGSKGIRHDCIKVLYEAGYREPKLLANYATELIGLLKSKDNRLQWGAMTALGCIVRVDPEVVYASLPEIIDAANKGSVITRDHCVNILISLSSLAGFSETVFPHLLEQMAKCPTNQLPMYAEYALPVVKDNDRESFVTILRSRLAEIDKDSKRKRIEKVINKVSR